MAFSVHFWFCTQDDSVVVLHRCKLACNPVLCLFGRSFCSHAVLLVMQCVLSRLVRLFVEVICSISGENLLIHLFSNLLQGSLSGVTLLHARVTTAFMEGDI